MLQTEAFLSCGSTKKKNNFVTPTSYDSIEFGTMQTDMKRAGNEKSTLVVSSDRKDSCSPNRLQRTESQSTINELWPNDDSSSRAMVKSFSENSIYANTRDRDLSSMVERSCRNKRSEPSNKITTSIVKGRPLRVLIYTAVYNVIDGVTLTVRKIEQEILSSGGHVCIVTTKSGNASNTNINGLSHPNRRVIFLDNSIPLMFLPDANNPDTRYHLGFLLSASVKKQIDEFAPTIIHITVPDCACLSIIQYARSHNLPLMGTYHSNIVDYFDHYPGMGWLKPILEAFFRHNYNFLQRLYVPTPFIRRHLSEKFDLNKITDLGIWGRGIDMEKFSPKYRCQEYRRKLGFKDDDVVICLVGRLVPEKRPDIFARVIRRLHSEGITNFKALVVGSGPCDELIKQLPNTVFAGWMSGEDLSIAYASSDIFFFPSSVETFGNVTLEAAASGLPLVVESGCSGHLVKDGYNGYACKAGDTESFYNATLSLILNRHKRQQFGINSSKYNQDLEQHRVMKKMLLNYMDVTHEFYDKYKGSHTIRDEEWRDKGEKSFYGGTIPIPIMLRVFIYIFTSLFQVVWVFMTCLDISRCFVLSLMLSSIAANAIRKVKNCFIRSRRRRLTEEVVSSQCGNPRNDDSESDMKVPNDVKSNMGYNDEEEITIYEKETRIDRQHLGDCVFFLHLSELFVKFVAMLARFDTVVLRCLRVVSKGVSSTKNTS